MKSQITPFQNTKPSKHLQTAGFGENMGKYGSAVIGDHLAPPLCASELKLEVRQMTQAWDFHGPGVARRQKPWGGMGSLKGTLIHWDPHLLILDHDMPSLSVLGRGGSGGGGTSSGLCHHCRCSDDLTPLVDDASQYPKMIFPMVDDGRSWKDHLWISLINT